MTKYNVVLLMGSWNRKKALVKKTRAIQIKPVVCNVLMLLSYFDRSAMVR